MKYFLKDTLLNCCYAFVWNFLKGTKFSGGQEASTWKLKWQRDMSLRKPQSPSATRPKKQLKEDFSNNATLIIQQGLWNLPELKRIIHIQ